MVLCRILTFIRFKKPVVHNSTLLERPPVIYAHFAFKWTVVAQSTVHSNVKGQGNTVALTIHWRLQHKKQMPAHALINCHLVIMTENGLLHKDQLP